MTSYAQPEVLVETQWVEEHLASPPVRIIEVDTNTHAYEAGHIPGAVFWNVYQTILQPDLHTTLDKSAVENLLARSGIANDSTVVFYGGLNSLAAWGFWFLTLFGHGDVRVLNGGRTKWLAEGRPLTTAVATVQPATYRAKEPNVELRARSEAVRAAMGQERQVLLDVRTPQEYRGEWFVSKPPEGAERAGHIPGATHLFYQETMNQDGTFKGGEDLQSLFRQHRIGPDKEVITYCAVGARAAHVWFVLKYLLGYPEVRSYDGSWVEWSRSPGALIDA